MNGSIAYEGHYESFLQFVLQLYIILTKADRNPTNLQLITLFTSLLTMVISGLNGYFKTDKAKYQMEAIKSKVI